MVGWEIIGLGLAAWVILGPAIGVMALHRANKTREELTSARTEIRRLRQRLDGAGDARDAPGRSSTHPAGPAQKATAVPATPPPEPVQQTPIKPPPATPAQTAPSPRLTQPSKQPSPHRPTRDWERLIAANWMVWAGGLALAMGGLFLVRVAIDAGYFGPLQRTIAAGVLGCGLIAAAFRAQRLETIASAENAIRFVPQVVAGAGLISLFGTAIASGLIYQFVSPLTAFALIFAVSALAVALSLRFGPMLAAPGLAGAYAAPLLTGAEGGSILPVLPYFAIVTAGGLALVRLSNWRWLTWILIIGAGFWGLVAAASTEMIAPLATGGYALALAGLGLFFGAKEAEKPLILPNNGIDPRYIAAGFGSSQLAAHTFWVLAGTLILLTGLQSGAGPVEAGALAVFGGLGLLAAWQRPGFALIAPLGAAITLTCVSLWAITAPPLVWACLASALGFGIGGTILMQNQKLKAPLAVSAALVPPAALFIAFWREGGLEPHFTWGLAALFTAVALSAVLDHLHRRDPGFKIHPGAGAAYALGALLSLALAPFLIFGGYWLGSSMAIVALAIAVVQKRFDLPLIRFGAMAATALSVGLLVRPGFIDPSAVSTVLIWNSMTFGFVIAIAALFAGSRLLSDRKTERQAFEAGALILTFVLIALTIRHISGDGRLEAPFGGIGEASAYAIAYLGMATSFVWRLSDKARLFKLAEYIAAAIGAVAVLFAIGQIGNGAVGDLPILNLLLVGFAMPAIIIAAYGAGLRRANRFQEATLASSGAMMLGFIWVSLEVARTFGGSDMQDFYGDFGWIYSLVWAAYAFALLYWGVFRKRRAPRYVSMAILLISTAKVFLFDMAALEGAARAISFIGLGIALIGIALFYQRFVLVKNSPETSDSAPGS